MIPIETLEINMESAIRSGLRRSMEYIDVANPINPLMRVTDSLESNLYETLYNQIRKIYGEGYIHGGHLIRKHAPANIMRAAATPLGDTITYEDPRIAKATKALIYGLEGSIEGHRNEIQAVIRTQFERGATVPMIADRLGTYFDHDRTAATRFARTAANDIYNTAQLDRYEDSGVVDGVQYSAHIDTRTSDICRVLNGTIWAIDDPGIQVPPNHFNCRSRINPYWGVIPEKRDYAAQFSSDMLKSAKQTQDTFRSKYWVPVPRTSASATLQRLYMDKKDILTLRDGLNLLTIAQRKTMQPNIIPLKLLKDRIRYRKLDPDKSTIVDAFGKGVMFDKFERDELKKAMQALIASSRAREARYITKGLDVLADGERDKIETYLGLMGRIS